MTSVIICASEERINLPHFMTVRLIKEGRAVLAPAHYTKGSRIVVSHES